MNEEEQFESGESSDKANDEEFTDESIKDLTASDTDQTIEYGSAEAAPEQIEPEIIDDDLARKRKRRNWWLIGTLGIALPILLITGSFVFVFLAIIGAFQDCAVQCCDNCAQSCANSCQESCCDSCSQSCNESCNSSCDNCCQSSCSSCTCSCDSSINAAEKSNNLKNIIKWYYHTIFEFIKGK